MRDNVSQAIMPRMPTSFFSPHHANIKIQLVMNNKNLFW